jgi:hypothetical protein
MKPNEKELKALRQFVSKDEARTNLATLWEYATEEGCTHIASDGHTLAMRRAGTHVNMTIADIEKLPAVSLDGSDATPPPWSSVLRKPNCKGKNPARRGIDPAYFARVAIVERAVAQRAVADYAPKPGLTRLAIKHVLEDLRNVYAIWEIGVDPLEAWYWTIEREIRWEGLIMPRRVL